MARRGKWIGLLACSLLSLSGTRLVADEGSLKPDGIRAKPFAQISLDQVVKHGMLPEDRASNFFRAAGEEWHVAGHGRGWYPMTYAWEAPVVGYQPLYFEDETLERLGHHHGWLQPAVSAAHFFGRIPVLPYLAGATPGTQCVSSLGYDRPGDCVPHYHVRAPWSWRGALFQAAAVTEGVLLIP